MFKKKIHLANVQYFSTHTVFLSRGFFYWSVTLEKRVVRKKWTYLASEENCIIILTIQTFYRVSRKSFIANKYVDIYSYSVGDFSGGNYAFWQLYLRRSSLSIISYPQVKIDVAEVKNVSFYYRKLLVAQPQYVHSVTRLCFSCIQKRASCKIKSKDNAVRTNFPL